MINKNRYDEKVLHYGKFSEKRYYNIPRVIVDNEQSSCEKTALRARILSYFYQKSILQREK
jgi:hypothetical protein